MANNADKIYEERLDLESRIRDFTNQAKVEMLEHIKEIKKNKERILILTYLNSKKNYTETYGQAVDVISFGILNFIKWEKNYLNIMALFNKKKTIDNIFHNHFSIYDNILIVAGWLELVSELSKTIRSIIKEGDPSLEEKIASICDDVIRLNALIENTGMLDFDNKRKAMEMLTEIIPKVEETNMVLSNKYGTNIIIEIPDNKERKKRLRKKYFSSTYSDIKGSNEEE
jgi:hypothetical protein